MNSRHTLGVILAGGRGSRLYPLTRRHVKPAVLFGGKYRVIDFVLSNFFNSGIFSIYVLVQYCSHSLIEHLRTGWVEKGMIREHFLTVVPPEMVIGEERYRGTADALYQNLKTIRHFDPEVVAVFGADHVFRMDVAQMIAFHDANRADVTVAAMPVSRAEATRFGVIEAQLDGRVTRLDEKPDAPWPIPGEPDLAFASMGNFLFRPDYLYDLLERAADSLDARPDFSADLLPEEVGRARIFAYNFCRNTVPGGDAREAASYWRDIGTIGAYFQAHMDLLSEPPRLNLENPQWPIRGARGVSPPTHLYRCAAENCLIAEGCDIQNAALRNVVVGRGARIEAGAELSDCVVLDQARVGRGAKLLRAIVDAGTRVEDGAVIRPGHTHTSQEWRYDAASEVLVVTTPDGAESEPEPDVAMVEEYY